MKFLDWLFEKKCVICEKNGDYLCKKCTQGLSPHPEHCLICHKQSDDYKTCKKCLREGNNIIEGVIVAFSYDTSIKKLIKNLKYKSAYDISHFFSLKLSYLISTYFDIHDTSILLSFVPSHRTKKIFIRGYNQSELLAQGVAQLLGLPFAKVCKKVRWTKKQAGLKRQQRLINLNEAFEINQKSLFISQKNIILIDDITTTGSTLIETAKPIKKLFPKVKIWGLVIARNSS
ncbi:MAG TPA: hypothetical protein PKC14_00040 [Candidatus Absconditabacterales bacterium]|nr:hypothetical protein [Candidatus Absconditabacterales bacterium]